MKNIRQRNDIDIVVHLKNNDGVALDPTQCSDMTVYLSCGSKKFFITEFEKAKDGTVKFRFNAEEQTRLGVYNITISATTQDDRTFTTDVCNAFMLVACSCDAGDDAGEVNIESIEVSATFEISAWGVISDIVTYEIPLELVELGTQHLIDQAMFTKIFGSPIELMDNLSTKHVRLKSTYVDEYEGTSILTIDATTSMTASTGIFIFSLNGHAALDIRDFADIRAVDARCNIAIVPNENGGYDYVEGYFVIDKPQSGGGELEDLSVTTEKIADNAVTSNKIADGAITQDKLAEGVGKDIVEYELPYEIESQSLPLNYEITEEEFNRIFGSFDDYLYNVEHKHIRFKTTVIANEEEEGVVVKGREFHTFDVLTTTGAKATWGIESQTVELRRFLSEGHCRINETEKVYFKLELIKAHNITTNETEFSCTLTANVEDVDSKISQIESNIRQLQTNVGMIERQVGTYPSKFDEINYKFSKIETNVTNISNTYVSQSQMDEAIANAITTTLNTEV